MESNLSFNHDSFSSQSLDNLFSLVNATLFDPVLFHSPYFHNLVDSSDEYYLNTLCEIECEINKNNKSVIFNINFNNRKVSCLYDTGASRNFIRKNVLNDLVEIGTFA